MGRPRKLSPAREAHIGRVVLEARAQNVPWKMLISRYRLSRSTLWKLCQAAKAKQFFCL